MYKSKLMIYFFLVTLIFVSTNCTNAFSSPETEKKWDELLSRDSFIYTVPRIKKTTLIDGIYVKKVLKKGEIVPCRRCPDWLPNPGVWRLYFNKGVYRIWPMTRHAFMILVFIPLKLKKDD